MPKITPAKGSICFLFGATVFRYIFFQEFAWNSWGGKAGFFRFLYDYQCHLVVIPPRVKPINVYKLLQLWFSDHNWEKKTRAQLQLKLTSLNHSLRNFMKKDKGRVEGPSLMAIIGNRWRLLWKHYTDKTKKIAFPRFEKTRAIFWTRAASV